MPRLDGINFNLVRAIEIFQDLNHEDMDVGAPPSDEDYSKEASLAHRLNDYLTDLIEGGFFRDCEPRDVDPRPPSDLESSTSRSQSGSSAYESGGFEVNADANAGSPSSRGSLTSRFKRYIRRILPPVVRHRKQQESDTRHHHATNQYEPDEEDEEEYQDDESVDDDDDDDEGDQETGPYAEGASDGEEEHHGRAGPSMGGSYQESVISRPSSRTSRSSSRSQSLSSLSAGSQSSSAREASLGSQPFDANVVYEHDHHHKHRHAGPHHHHDHSNDRNHTHTHHTHSRERDSSQGGLSNYFRSYGVDEGSSSRASLTSHLGSSPLSRARSSSRSRPQHRSRSRGRGSRGSRKRRNRRRRQPRRLSASSSR